MAIPILPLLADPTIGPRLRATFATKAVRSDDPSECWGWFGTTRRGYGQVSVSGNVKLSAHRLSYAMHTGTDPGDLLVCHRCDNPICTNPAHLFLGTDKDNSDDKIAKGRNRGAILFGERNPRAKLMDDDVAAIRVLLSEGLSNTEIAFRYGVTHSTISAIRLGKIRARSNIYCRSLPFW